MILNNAIGVLGDELRQWRALVKLLPRYGLLMGGVLGGSLALTLVLILNQPVDRTYYFAIDETRSCLDLQVTLDRKTADPGAVVARPAPDYRRDDVRNYTACRIDLDASLAEAASLAKDLSTMFGEEAWLMGLVIHGHDIGLFPMIAAWLIPMISVLVFMVWRRREIRSLEQPVTVGTALNRGLQYFLIWIGLLIVFFVPLALLLGIDRPAENFMTSLIDNPWLIVLAVLGAPIGEELLFRRMAFRLFLERGFGFMGAILTSFTFAAVHLQYISPHLIETLYIWLQLFILSLLLCHLYRQTRHVLAPITMHMLCNLMATIIWWFAA